MALIFISIDGKKWKVKCKDLIPLVQTNFASETTKNQWSYSEFCDLVQDLPSETLCDFINGNTGNSVKSTDPVLSFEKDTKSADILVGSIPTPPTPFEFNEDCTIKNASSLNIAALTIALQDFHNSTYNFVSIDHARKALAKLEKERSENLRQTQENHTENREITTKMSTIVMQPVNWECPKFNGSSDPEEFIQKVENLAKVGSWSEDYKISVAIMGLSGNANMWYRTSGEKLKDKKWDEWKKQFLEEFKKNNGGLGMEWHIFLNRKQMLNETPQAYIYN